VIVDKTRSELEFELLAATKVLQQAVDAGNEALAQETKDELIRIRAELDSNPPVRYSIDWECVVSREDANELEFIWVSGKEPEEAAMKVFGRCTKAGWKVKAISVVQSVLAPRWS